MMIKEEPENGTTTTEGIGIEIGMTTEIMMMTGGELTMMTGGEVTMLTITPQTDGMMLEIELEEPGETPEIMYMRDGMTSEIGLKIGVTELEELPGMLETMPKIDGMTPETKPEELTETSGTMLKIDGRIPRIGQDAPTETLVMMLKTNGRTPKIMLQTNGIPSNIRPTTSMSVQRIVPIILPRA